MDELKYSYVSADELMNTTEIPDRPTLPEFPDDPVLSKDIKNKFNFIVAYKGKEIKSIGVIDRGYSLESDLLNVTMRFPQKDQYYIEKHRYNTIKYYMNMENVNKC